MMIFILAAKSPRREIDEMWLYYPGILLVFRVIA